MINLKTDQPARFFFGMWCRSICSWHPTCLLVGMTGWYDVRIWKNREAVDGSFKKYRLSLLVGGLENDFCDFPYIGNNDPNWLIFFRGVEATNQIMMRIVTIMTNMVIIKTVVYTLDWLARDIVVIWVMWVRSKNIPCQNKLLPDSVFFLMFNQIGDDNPQALIYNFPEFEATSQKTYSWFEIMCHISYLFFHTTHAYIYNHVYIYICIYIYVYIYMYIYMYI